MRDDRLREGLSVACLPPSFSSGALNSVERLIREEDLASSSSMCSVAVRRQRNRSKRNKSSEFKTCEPFLTVEGVCMISQLTNLRDELLLRDDVVVVGQ